LPTSAVPSLSLSPVIPPDFPMHSLLTSVLISGHCSLSSLLSPICSQMMSLLPSTLWCPSLALHSPLCARLCSRLSSLFSSLLYPLIFTLYPLLSALCLLSAVCSLLSVLTPRPAGFLTTFLVLGMPKMGAGKAAGVTHSGETEQKEEKTNVCTSSEAWIGWSLLTGLVICIAIAVAGTLHWPKSTLCGGSTRFV
jgi:hypothetical protein